MGAVVTGRRIGKVRVSSMHGVDSYVTAQSALAVASPDLNESDRYKTRHQY